MESRIVELARLLRRNGLRLSPAEVADGVAAAALVGVEERAALRAALRATLVKRSADVPTFEAIFEAHFGGLGRLVAAAERSLLAAIEEAGLLEGDELEMVLHTLARAAAGAGPVGAALLRGDRAGLARLLRQASLQLDGAALGEGQEALAALRLLAAAGGAELEAEARAAQAALRALPLDPARLDLLSGALREAFEGVERSARAFAAERLAARARARRTDALPPPGSAPPPPAELARLEAAVVRLADRLRARLVRRERARRGGALSVRRTLRANLGLEGLPARLRWRSSRRERPDLVVLCDVSESMRHVSRLMLLFLAALQLRARRVRTFVFVSDVGEVTAALASGSDPARGAERAVASQAAARGGNSNYGRALRDFHRRHRAAVGPRTTVIVVGDGRTNYAPPEDWALEALRRRARRVLWICPEPRERWGAGDSEMHRYAARCDRVATVCSLADLEGLADALLPRGGRRAI